MDAKRSHDDSVESDDSVSVRKRVAGAIAGLFNPNPNKKAKLIKDMGGLSNDKKRKIKELISDAIASASMKMYANKDLIQKIKDAKKDQSPEAEDAAKKGLAEATLESFNDDFDRLLRNEHIDLKATEKEELIAECKKEVLASKANTSNRNSDDKSSLESIVGQMASAGSTPAMAAAILCLVGYGVREIYRAIGDRANSLNLGDVELGGVDTGKEGKPGVKTELPPAASADESATQSTDGSSAMFSAVPAPSDSNPSLNLGSDTGA